MPCVVPARDKVRNTKYEVLRISYIDPPTSYTKYKSVSYFVYRFSNLYTKYKSVSYFVFHFLTCRIQNTKYKSRGERQELARRGGGQTGSEYNSGGRARRADGRGADGARSQTGARGANTIVGGVRGAQTGGAQTGRALRRAAPRSIWSSRQRRGRRRSGRRGFGRLEQSARPLCCSSAKVGRLDLAELIHPFSCRSLMHSCTHSLIHSCTHSLMHSGAGRYASGTALLAQRRAGGEAQSRGLARRQADPCGAT